jgi:hypothetical protein
VYHISASVWFRAKCQGSFNEIVRRQEKAATRAASWNFGLAEVRYGKKTRVA